MDMQELFSSIFLILGALVLFISGLGILRMPTFLTRIHPGAKSSTLGIMLFFIGVSIAAPHWAPRLLVAGILFLFTGPVAASALARTALTKEEKEKFYDTSDKGEEE